MAQEFLWQMCGADVAYGIGMPVDSRGEWLKDGQYNTQETW